jgi:hypothetical protein
MGTIFEKTEREINFELQVEGIIGHYLAKTYPGYEWYIDADARGGIVTISSTELSGKYGFIMKLQDVLDDPSMRRVRDAGGEYLERFHQSRAGFNVNDYTAAPVDFMGNLIPDK